MLEVNAQPVFPTGVGMNRKTTLTRAIKSGVPHGRGRGDEPQIADEIERHLECSNSLIHVSARNALRKT